MSTTQLPDPARFALDRLNYALTQLRHLDEAPFYATFVGPLPFRRLLLRRAIYSLLDDCARAHVGDEARAAVAAAFPER